MKEKEEEDIKESNSILEIDDNSQIDVSMEDPIEVTQIDYDTMKGKYSLYEDETGIASDPIHGLYRSDEKDPELEELGLMIDLGNNYYLQPITIKTTEGYLIPVPTNDERWYKWVVIMNEDDMSFEFKKEEYYQAITLMMKYDDLKHMTDNNNA